MVMAQHLNEDDNKFERYRRRTEANETQEESLEYFDGEWLLHSGTLKGNHAELRTFASHGILVSFIANQNIRMNSRT